MVPNPSQVSPVSQPGPFITSKGLHPSLGNFVHVLLPAVEQGVTRVLAVVGDSALLHEIDAAGHIVSTAVDIPLFREITQVLDLLSRPVQQ